MALSLPASKTHFSQAVTFARQGRFRDAEGLLAASGGEEAPIEALDLRARMAAQQGQLAAAEQLWLSVLARDPGHHGALTGVATARARQSRRSIAPLLAWILIPLSWLAVGTATTLKQMEILWRQELGAAQEAQQRRLDQLGTSLIEQLDALQSTQSSLNDATISIESTLASTHQHQDQANKAMQERLAELHGMVDQVRAQVATVRTTWTAPKSLERK